MRLLLVLALLAGGAYYFFFRSGPDVELVESGGQQTLLLRQADAKAEYAVGEPYEETFMLFGASAKHELAHALFSGVTTRYAAFLLRQYPTISKCGTPGTKEAIAALKTFKVVGREPALRERLLAAVKLYDERFKANGDRVCLRVGGSRITLRSAEKGGGPFFLQQPPDWFALLGDSVETFDCSTIVSPG